MESVQESKKPWLEDSLKDPAFQLECFFVQVEEDFLDWLAHYRTIGHRMPKTDRMRLELDAILKRCFALYQDELKTHCAEDKP